MGVGGRTSEGLEGGGRTCEGLEEGSGGGGPTLVNSRQPKVLEVHGGGRIWRVSLLWGGGGMLRWRGMGTCSVGGEELSPRRGGAAWEECLMNSPPVS